LSDDVLENQKQVATAAATALLRAHTHTDTTTSRTSALKSAPHRLTRVPKQHHKPPLSYRSQYNRHLAAQQLFGASSFPQAHHICDDKGHKQTLDQLLSGPNKEIWIRSASNEFGRIAQGNIYGVTYQNGIDYIPKSEVPEGRDVTYASFVCDYRPLKPDKYRVRLVVGGDRLTRSGSL